MAKLITPGVSSQEVLLPCCERVGFSTKITSKFYQCPYICHLAQLSYALHKVTAVLFTTSAFGSLNDVSSLFLKKFIHLFIYFWLCRVFVAACGLSLVAESGGYSSLRCAGLSMQWPLLLRSMGSMRAGSAVTARRLSSCGVRAQPLRSMWDPPRPGLEPVSPALAGGLPTTAPPGRSLLSLLIFSFCFLV